MKYEIDIGFTFYGAIQRSSKICSIVGSMQPISCEI